MAGPSSVQWNLHSQALAQYVWLLRTFIHELAHLMSFSHARIGEFSMLEAVDFLAQVDAISRQLYGYANRMLVDSSDTEDVMADAVLTAWSERNRFKRGTNFKGWLFRILLNKIYSTNRRRRLTTQAIRELGHVRTRSVQQEGEMALDSCSDELKQALARLNDGERDAFLLLSLGELSYAEIAEATGAPVTTVITRLGRARTKLKALLKHKPNAVPGP